MAELRIYTVKARVVVGAHRGKDIAKDVRIGIESVIGDTDGVVASDVVLAKSYESFDLNTEAAKETQLELDFVAKSAA